MPVKATLVKFSAKFEGWGTDSESWNKKVLELTFVTENNKIIEAGVENMNAKRMSALKNMCDVRNLENLIGQNFDLEVDSEGGLVSINPHNSKEGETGISA